MVIIPRKTCTRCKEEKPATDKYFHKHPNGKFGVKSICIECKRQEYQDSINERREQKRKYYKNLWLSIVNHYGGKCAMCGESRLEFLTIDHVDGGGRKQVKLLGGKRSLYRWIIKNNFPNGFQVLCWNHNYLKHVVVLEAGNTHTNHAERSRRYNNKCRDRVFNNYGRRCTCCGESDLRLLTIDHINGGGTKQTKEIGGNFYLWLIKNGFPPYFQVLCHNCNSGREINKGICPHFERGLMARSYTKYLTWLSNEFKPLTLATPETTQKQLVENAIRFWNTNSAYKVSTMVDYTPGTKRVQLNTQFKAVADIYPCKTTTWIWNDHQFFVGDFIGRPISNNSVNCGNIRASQTTRRPAVTMFECGQSATKPFTTISVKGRLNEHNRNISL
jgi:hypothetical protein